MSAPTRTDLPTVADFLDEATARLDYLATLLSPRRWEDVDCVAAVRELSRIVAQHNAALRALAGRGDVPDQFAPADPTQKAA